MYVDSLLDAPIFHPAHQPPSTLQEIIVTRPEVIRSGDSHTVDMALRFDMTKISTGWCHLRDRLTAASVAASCRTAADAPVPPIRRKGIEYE